MRRTKWRIIEEEWLAPCCDVEVANTAQRLDGVRRIEESRTRRAQCDRKRGQSTDAVVAAQRL